MKKIIFGIIALLCAISAMSQSDRYHSAMLKHIQELDQLTTISEWTEKGNAFARIGDAEKNQWLPYYYASYCTLLSGYMQSENPNPNVLDPIADKAEAWLMKAEELSPKNSEIEVLKKMIADLRLVGDPMNRWQIYGEQGELAINNAKAFNPDNPRIYLIQGQTLYYTPVEYGGGPAVAKPLFETALQKYEIFKPESDLHPNWGKSRVEYFLPTIK